MAQQTINLGAAPDDGTGDTLRAGGDKINDNFDELYDEALKFKGSTDCSTNPNYPAALKGDAYRVSVAGKIGGASGVDVEVADLYFATADNAGGDQATVGTSWSVLQGNITSYLPLSGGTLAGDLIVPDEAYDATNWDGSLEVPTKNAVRDKIEALSAGSGIAVEDEGVSEGTGLTTLNFTGAGVSVTVTGAEAEVIIPGGGIDVEDEGVSEAAGAATLNFVGAGVTATDAGGGVVDVTIPGGGSWGNWTELTFAGSTSLNLGRTSYLANETFSSAATDRLEIEVEVEKTSTSDFTVGVKVGTAGVYIAGQSDGNVVMSRYSGGAATVLGSSGANAQFDYDGSYVVRHVVNLQSSTSLWTHCVVNDYRVPFSNSAFNVTTFSMLGTMEVFVEGTIKRARARLIA